MSQFSGKAEPVQNEDFERAAERLCCDVSAVRAVAEVESGGGTRTRSRIPPPWRRLGASQPVEPLANAPPREILTGLPEPSNERVNPHEKFHTV